MLLLAALEHDCRHPTAEQLYESLRPHHPSLSLSTVYQTLDAFMRTGLCRRVSDAGDRLRVDGTPQDHDHAVCRICGTIFDVDRQLLPLPTPPAQLPPGLTVTGLRVEYEVICATCREAWKGEDPPSLARMKRRGPSRENTDQRRVKHA
jgi:Fur family peroxide stress response transcriptional regulator